MWHEGHELYRGFHGFRPMQVRRARHRRIAPRVLVRLGRLRAVIYSSGRGDGRERTYIHFMRTPPILACDPDGRQLRVVGGRYRVTCRGIVG